MAGEGPDTAPNRAKESSPQDELRSSQDELLLHAVSVLRIRYEQGNGYPGLSPTAARELGRTFIGLTDASHPIDDGNRSQAIALAHRLIDNDCPELSPMWPGPSEQT